MLHSFTWSSETVCNACLYGWAVTVVSVEKCDLNVGFTPGEHFILPGKQQTSVGSQKYL